MIRDFYLNVANEMMDLADERLEEAKKLQKQADEMISLSNIQEEDFFEVVDSIRKRYKITSNRIANKMGISMQTVNSRWGKKSSKISLAFALRILHAMEVDLCIVEPGGKFHKIQELDYFKKNDKTNGFQPDRGKSAKQLQANPEVFFK